MTRLICRARPSAWTCSAGVPQCRFMITSTSRSTPSRTASKATEAGRHPRGHCVDIDTDSLPPHVVGWSAAAARKVSAAPRITRLVFRNEDARRAVDSRASFPEVPFTHRPSDDGGLSGAVDPGRSCQVYPRRDRREQEPSRRISRMRAFCPFTDSTATRQFEVLHRASEASRSRSAMRRDSSISPSRMAPSWAAAKNAEGRPSEPEDARRSRRRSASDARVRGVQ